MQAVILSVGTELVTGQSVDTNSALAFAGGDALGLHVVEHVTVGDDENRLESAIRSALEKAEIVVITGGLGPTRDDVTRAALAAALETTLEEDAEALQQISGFFARWQRSMPDSNRLQALMPRGCRVLENRRGTAPGIGWSRDGRHLFALPGVPSEMKEMFREHVLHVIEGMSRGARSASLRLLCFGIGEAKLGEKLADLMVRDRNPLVGTTASGAVLSVRIVGWAADKAQARALVDRDVAEIRRRLGHVVYGEGETTLQDVVARILMEKRLTIATAESCTGGLLAGRLTDVPGSSDYFLRGFVTYANAAKTAMLGVPADFLERAGAVSAEVAEAMAVGCRERAGTDLAISITGIAGPDGGHPPERPVGLVFIALADAAGVRVERFLFGEHLSRGEIRDRSCKTALNLLRLKLLGVANN